ncbi:MAG: PLP-dependent transferase [Clostridia bacterium]|nr:PLP-dependent transferase [Clostridia bacterium]
MKNTFKIILLSFFTLCLVYVTGCRKHECVESDWIYPKNYTHLCSCTVDETDIEAAIKNAKRLPDAIYLTSPDYLGNITDIAAISRVCKKYGILLLVDNAHGAYLKFLNGTAHPLDLGADMCCDSAHKTLPVLTGGAYLHIGKNCDDVFLDICNRAFKIHGGTSPSYLILQSLDLCNKYLANSFKSDLKNCIEKISDIKLKLSNNGFYIQDGEPLKIVINAAKSGYSGLALCEQLKQNNIIPEFYDQDFIVLMATPQNKESDFDVLANTLLNIKAKPPIERDIIKPQYHQ